MPNTKPGSGVLYVDGHVREYHGKNRLSKTHITRTRRAAPAATDTWVNDINGNPLFVVTSEINRGLTKMLEPVLSEVRGLVGADRKITVVFDRGGFSPRLFARLAENFHIITYWKGKKLPRLPDHAFEKHEIEVDGKKIGYRPARCATHQGGTESGPRTNTALSSSGCDV